MLESVSINVKSYSKLNLYLKVLDKRPDNFHNIHSVFQSIDLADELSFSLQAGLTGIQIKSSNPDVPTDDDNLISKAYYEIAQYAEPPDGYGIVCEIVKNIPIGSGLGGGSSNCAASLVALNQLLKADLEFDKLMEIGVKLGSDVPFFFLGGTAYVYGRGEKIESLPSINTGVFFIVSPKIKISTAEAYNLLDEYRFETGFSLDSDYDHREIRETMHRQIIEGGFESFMYNDFETPLFLRNPEIKRIKEKLEMLTPATMMTGSGSSVFAYFNDFQTAWEKLEKFDRSEDEVVNIVAPVNEGYVIHG